MRAALVTAVGQPPALDDDIDEPRPNDGEALVEVTAAPVNPIDLSIAGGRFYTGPPDVPYVPGREGLGRVLSGSGRFAEGTRVYFSAPAKKGRSGGMAERAAIADDELIEVPGGVEDAHAACYGIAGLAAWLPLEWRARVQEGETVLVLGASGAVGLIAVQAAKLLGAGRVVAAARDPDGLARARERGADATVDLAGDPANLADRMREAGGGGIDVVIDPLWGAPARAAVEALNQHGRLVQIGQSAAAEATLTSASVRGRMAAILGHTNFAAPMDVRTRAFQAMCGHAAAGRLRVEHETVALDRVAEAWERQAAFPHRKLVLEP